MSDTAVAMSDTAVALTAEQLSHLRHDLRTPIGQITGYGEMAVEDAEAEGSEELAAVVRTAIAAANAVMIRQNALLLSESSEATLQHLA
ncbi:MAG: histidine kinase dimerization/phospho-acceptor domain-containing protein [Bryobacteraceae bacterium]|nr:histidine kinase dimerization/phospho-acceptor domain-containing protein [Bryobacteraceae bacterium]